MEYLFFLFILIIVIATGYVLSKPFTRQSESSYEKQIIDYQRQYQNLLEEIKGIEKECESGSIPIDDCIHQINERKQMAADLLRTIDPTMAFDSVINDDINQTETDINRPIADPLSTDVHYCPQCAGRVLLSDKFCLHCGNRLQP